MKKFIAIFMSFMILLGAYKDVVVYLSFKINQDYISNFLCINRDVPESTCNGKCLLSKTIKENHEPSENSNIPFLTENKQQLFFLIFDWNKKLNFHLNSIKNNPLIASDRVVDSNYMSDVFHPPQV